MTGEKSRFRWRPTPVGGVAGGLVILGFLLCEVNWGFLVLVGLGTLGPGILRELGWVRDKDEFQRRAAHQAGYHAYLSGGLLSFLLVAYLRSGERVVEHPESLVTLVLVTLWFTWLLSSLLSYWGPRRTAMRLLIIFGSVWLLFNILSNWQSPVGMFMQCLVTVPFFGTAYLARRWPRVAGLLLLGAAAFFTYLFGLYEIFGPNPFEKGRGFVIVLFLGPLVTSGIALLRDEDVTELP